MGWKDRIQPEEPTKASWRDRVKPEELSDEVETSAPEVSPSILAQIMEGLTPSQETQEELLGAGETAIDASKGFAQGKFLGGLDEFGGALGAVAEKGLSYLPGTGAYETARVDELIRQPDAMNPQGGQVPEDSMADKYKTYQEGIEADLEASKERSPWAYGGAELLGGMQSGNALARGLGLGGKATSGEKLLDIARSSGKLKATGEAVKRGATAFSKAAPVLGLESGLASKADLIGPDRDIGGVVKDVAGGLTFGAAGMLGMKGVGELSKPITSRLSKAAENTSEAIQKRFTSEDNPKLNTLYDSYKYGLETGVNPKSQAARLQKGGFSQKDQQAALNMLDPMDITDETLGTAVGDSIRKATERGAIVNITPDIADASARVLKLSETFGDLGRSVKSTQAYDKILNGAGTLTPEETKHLIDDIDYSIGMFKRSQNNLRPEEAGILQELFTFRGNISNTLKKSATEYGEAAEKFEDFRKVREALVSGKRPSEITGVFYGKLNNAEKLEYDRLIDMIKHVKETSSSSGDSKTAFLNFTDALDEFKTKHPTAFPGIEQMRGKIMKASQDYQTRNDPLNVKESTGFIPDIKTVVFGKLPNAAAFYTGDIERKSKLLSKKFTDKINKPINSIKLMMDAPVQTQYKLADSLETNSSKTLNAIGKSLRDSLDKGDVPARNRALFLIGQNPNAKILFSSEEPQDEENME